MRIAATGALVVAGLVMLALLGLAGRNPLWGQAPAPRRPAAASGEIIALSFDESKAERQVVIIDVKTRVVSVYHVDRVSGELTLKSVRNVTWDLQMEEYNGNSPSPREIRRLLERR